MKERWEPNFYWISMSDSWTRGELKYLLDVDNKTIHTVVCGTTIPFISPVEIKDCVILMCNNNVGVFESEGGSNLDIYRYHPDNNNIEKIHTYDNSFRMAFSNNKLWTFNLEIIDNQFELYLKEYSVNYDPEFTSTLNKSFALPLFGFEFSFMIFVSSFFAKDDNTLILIAGGIAGGIEDNTLNIMELDVSGDSLNINLLFTIESESDDFIMSIGSGYYNNLNESFIFNLLQDVGGYPVATIVEYSLSGELINSIIIENMVIPVGYFKHNNKLNCFTLTESDPMTGSTYEITNSGISLINYNITNEMIIDFQQNTGCINMSLPVIPPPPPIPNYFNDVYSVGGIKYVNLNNELWGWGYNYYGSVGINSTSPVIIDPSRVCGDHVFSKIVIDNETTLALDVSGQTWGWGYNGYGELGINTIQNTISTFTITPYKIYGEHNFNDILISNHNVIAVDGEGGVWEWGKLHFNQKIPHKIQSDHIFTDIQIKPNYVIAKDINNKVWSWGYNYYGELGHISMNNNIPNEVQGEHTFIKIVANDNYVLGLDDNGICWSWGYNVHGNLGLNDNVDRSTPTMISNHTFTDIYNDPFTTTSNKISFGKDNLNRIWAWGYNYQGNLGIGIGSYTNTSTPSLIFGDHVFNDFHFNYDTVFAVDDSGKTWAWGNNNHGKTGTNIIGMYSTPAPVYGDHNFIKFHFNQNHTFAIDDSGQTWTWGYNGYGQLGTGNYYSQITPALLYGNPNFKDIYTSDTTTMAIDNDGYLWGWGVGTLLEWNVISLTPKKIFTNHIFKNIYLKNDIQGYGAYLCCTGVDYSGNTWSWGYNNNGQLGIGSYDNKSSPTLLHGNHTFSKIFYINGEFSTYGTYGIDNYNNIWGWGINYNLDTSSTTPVKLNSIEYSELYYNNGTYAAIDNSGLTWNWGNVLANENNMLTPCKINISDSLKYISKGYDLNIVYNDNKSWAWGNNDYGQLGNGTNIMKESPTEIYGNHTFCKIFTNFDGNSVFGIDNNGQSWAWGNNDYGQLGIGPTNCYTYMMCVPTPVCGNHTFNHILSAYNSAFGIDNNGLVWGWGYNYFGQLGLGDTDDRHTPTLIENHTFCKIHDGGIYTIGIDIYGQSWGWGYNGYGKLGVGDIENKTSPTIIYGEHDFCKFSLDLDRGILGSFNKKRKKPVGGFNVLSMDKNNEVWGWGYKMAAVPVIPVKINNTSFCDIKIDSSSVFGLDNNGKLWVWGDNRYGQLGINNTENQFVPIDIQGHNFCKIYLMSETGKN